MSRLSWILIVLLITGGLAAVFLARGANKDLKPYLGKWSGGFSASEPTNNLSGFLQLYASNDRFTMQLQGPQQTIVVKGTWTLVRPNRIEVKPGDIQIDDFGGKERRDPNKPYLPDGDVRAAYSKPLIFDLSDDKKKLTGLLISIGKVSGKHEFEQTFGNVR